jgi:hypothetical protein
MRAGSWADQRSAARRTSSLFDSFTCRTSRNMTTVVRPAPLCRARSVARRKARSSPVLRLNEARRPSTTRSDGPPGRGTNRSGPKRCSGKVLGLIRLQSVPWRRPGLRHRSAGSGSACPASCWRAAGLARRSLPAGGARSEAPARLARAGRDRAFDVAQLALHSACNERVIDAASFTSASPLQSGVSPSRSSHPSTPSHA